MREDHKDPWWLLALTYLIVLLIGLLLGYNAAKAQDVDLDDAFLIDATAPLPDSVPAYALPAEVVLFEDGFEGDFPGIWRLSGCRYGHTWGQVDCRVSSGDWALWCADQKGGGTRWSGLDACEDAYPVWVCAHAEIGPFDLSEASAASLEFDWWLRTPLWGFDNDRLHVTAGPGRDLWPVKLTRLHDYGDEWHQEEVNLLSLCGEPRVYVRFSFFSDGYTVPAFVPSGAFLDNVRLVATMPGAEGPTGPTGATGATGSPFTDLLRLVLIETDGDTLTYGVLP